MELLCPSYGKDINKMILCLSSHKPGRTKVTKPDLQSTSNRLTYSPTDAPSTPANLIQSKPTALVKPSLKLRESYKVNDLKEGSCVIPFEPDDRHLFSAQSEFTGQSHLCSEEKKHSKQSFTTLSVRNRRTEGVSTSIALSCSSDGDSAFEALVAKLRTPKPIKSDSSGLSDFVVSDNSVDESDASSFDPTIYRRIDKALSTSSSCENMCFSAVTRPQSTVSSDVPCKELRDKRPSRVHRQRASPKKPLTAKNDQNELRSSNPQASRLPHLEFPYSLYSTEGTPPSWTKGRQRHPSAERYLTQFQKHRVHLSNRLLKLFNESVFNHLLPDDLEVTWNPRLLKTAGQCKYLRRNVTKSGNVSVTRLVQIELSPKVCTTAERVRDTLLHEACHAAVWLASGVNDGHGKLWRQWASQAKSAWPHLPVVSVCHNYAIHTRYTYRCTGCGACVNRHSKSLDLQKQVCGRCRNRFTLLVNKRHARGESSRKAAPSCTDASGEGKQSLPSRTPAFAEFVQKHYKTVRASNNVSSHSDAMKQLGILFKGMKVSGPD